MSDEVLEHRIGRVETEVERLRPRIHDLANEVTKVEFIVEMYKSAAQAQEARDKAINARLDLITDKLSVSATADAAKHARYDEHLAQCESRNHRVGYIIAGLIVSLAGSTFAALTQLLGG